VRNLDDAAAQLRTHAAATLGPWTADGHSINAAGGVRCAL